MTGEVTMSDYTDEQLANLVRADSVHKKVYTDPEILPGDGTHLEPGLGLRGP